MIPIGRSGVATLIPVGTTDTAHSSVLHIPDLSLIVSGDVVYNRTHLWLSGSTPDSRANWARALDAVAALNAGTLIAGHRHPQAADDDARRQIGESRRYLEQLRGGTGTQLHPGRAHRPDDDGLPGPGQPLHAVGRGP